MRFTYRYAVRHPVAAVCLGVILVAAAAPGVFLLKIRTDGHALVPPDASEIAIDRAVRDQFGIEDPIVVLVRSTHPDGMFNAETMELVQELTDALGALEQINAWNVISLATERSDRVRRGTLIFRRFLEPPPCTPVQLHELATDLAAIQLYNGTLFSSDGIATAILVGVPDQADRTFVYGRIVETIDGLGPRSEVIDVIGAPVAEALLGTHILEDLGVPEWILGHGLVEPGTDRISTPRSFYEWRVWVARHVGLVPVALLVMVLVFYACFRSLAASFLPLMEAGACLVFVFGCMGYLGAPVYLTVAVLPVILTAMGIADEIHIFTRFREHLRVEGLEIRDVVLKTMDEMFLPVLKTSLTTSIGFLSFAMSPVRPVQVFGLFTALGILFCLVWSLTVIPALLVSIPRHWFVREGTTVRRARVEASRWSIVPRLRWPVLAIAIVFCLIATRGVARVQIQDSWIDGFAPESRFHRATTYCNEQFFGTHTLQVRVQVETPPVIDGEVEFEGVADHYGLLVPAELVRDPQELIDSRLFLAREVPPRRTMHPWDALIEKVTRRGDAYYVETARRGGSPKIALSQRGSGKARFRIVAEPLTRPDLIRALGDFEAFLASHREEAVGGVLGPASYLTTTSYMAQARRAGSRSIPSDRNRIRWLWKQYEKVRTPERRQQAVTAEFDAALLRSS